MKKRFEIQEGNEIRGFRIRLYPSKEQEERLLSISERCRVAWNALVRESRDAEEAHAAHAVRAGLVSPRPSVCYDGLLPEEASEAKQKHRAAIIDWYTSVRKASPCKYRKLKDSLEHFGLKYDYHLLNRMLAWRGLEPLHAHILQALVKNLYSRGHKKPRRKQDVMPLQVGSGDCFELGVFGARGKNSDFYNCRVKFSGMRLLGRLPGKSPEGRVIQGVSIKQETDGWWASIKVECCKRALPPAVKGKDVGLDVGRDNLAAFSDGTIIPSNRALAERIAGRQAMRLDVSRLQTQEARNAKHIIYNEIIKPLADAETIVVEKLSKGLGNKGGTRKVSRMSLVLTLLKQRYGDRVREVEPDFTSQDCSQCGRRSKDSWSYEAGPICTCPFCGHRQHRDVNAARNIARKYRISESV